jgi:hypothetical protein
MYAEDSISVNLESFQLPISCWTTVSTNEKLPNHLLLLFWNGNGLSVA